MGDTTHVAKENKEEKEHAHTTSPGHAVVQVVCHSRKHDGRVPQDTQMVRQSIQSQHRLKIV